MAGITVNSKHTGTVSDFSNSGNPVVKLERASKKIVVKVREGKEIDKGDKLEFTIQSDNNTHFLANLLSHASAGSPHNHNSTPNIPIHHDGKSATSSRSEKEATKSVEDREFDPTTDGAPRTSSEKRKRKFLREDE
jgi:hypothetical protein